MVGSGGFRNQNWGDTGQSYRTSQYQVQIGVVASTKAALAGMLTTGANARHYSSADHKFGILRG